MIERKTSKEISVVEIMTPGIAAGRGLPPAEYVEVTLPLAEWDGIGGMLAMVVVEQHLQSNGVVRGYPEMVSPRGNTVLRIEREDGPRVRITDNLIYRLGQLKQLFRGGKSF